MIAPLQFAFKLDPAPALGRDDLLAGACNADAIAWIDRWPDWPGNGLAVCGPEACGKTHLGRVWRGLAQAVEIAGPDLTIDDAGDLASGPVLVEAADRAPARALLHLYNLIVQRRFSILLIAREPPSRWGTTLPDLASRLAALPVAPIASPDDRLIHAVLAKLFRDRQLSVSNEALCYLLARMERSFAAASRLAAAIDRNSLARHLPVTIRLIRDVLEDEASVTGP
jgi:chromosomal replication initiation ATPase DnaA